MNIPDEAPDTHCVDTPAACSPAGTVPGKLLQWMAAGTDLINMHLGSTGSGLLTCLKHVKHHPMIFDIPPILENLFHMAIG